MSNESLPPFQQLLDEHGSDVLGYLVATVGPHDAEDVFQETFIAALRAYPRLEHAATSAPGCSPSPTARRSTTTAPAAAAPSRPETPRRWPGLARAPTGPDKSSAPGSHLWRAVSALPPKQRSAVVLRYATDMSYTAIAQAMDSSEAAARRNVHEGLQKLRGEFA